MLDYLGSDDLFLSGMRPSGKLHLGHKVGALDQWLIMQQMGVHCFLLVADVQALSTHADNPKEVLSSVYEAVRAWIGVGLDPSLPNVHFVLQSAIPELHEMTGLFAQVTHANWIGDIPTIKDERIQQVDRNKPVTSGFEIYPISQASDIFMVLPFVKNGKILVPVGQDQVPIIELDNRIARTFMRKFPLSPKFPEAIAVLGDTPRLPAIQGKGKMSKSEGSGSILLSESDHLIRTKVNLIETDPARIRADIPGDPAKNRVFEYLDAFDSNKAEVKALRRRYMEATVSDREIKDRLAGILINMITPIRDRYNQVTLADAQQALRDGTDFLRPHVAKLAEEMRIAMSLNFLTISQKELDDGNNT